MDSVLSADLPIRMAAKCGSASLQLAILSGAKKNSQIDFESTSLFLGSDPECDLILDPTYFPPMYAFLLIESHSVILRHLGGGPVLFVDRQPIQRRRIETLADVHAGPLSLSLQVTPSTSGAQTPKMNSAVESGTQLIEQASRLLLSIGKEQMGIPSSGESSEKMTEVAPLRHNHLSTSDDLKLSVGLPASGPLPPTWQHICL